MEYLLQKMLIKVLLLGQVSAFGYRCDFNTQGPGFCCRYLLGSPACTNNNICYGSECTANNQVCQQADCLSSKPACASQWSPVPWTDTFSYSSSGTKAKPIYNVFSNSDQHENCIFTTCTLGTAGNCGTPPTSLRSYLDLTGWPWKLKSPRNVVAGYTETFCLRCSYDYQGVTINVDNDNIQVTQYPDCSTQIGAATTPITTRQVAYDPNSSGKVDIGAGWSDLFQTLDSTNCMFDDCEIYDVDCGSNPPNYVEINSGSPWILKARRDVPGGFTRQICVECDAGSASVTAQWTYIQDPLDCSGAMTMNNYATQNIAYSPSNNLKYFTTGYGNFFSHSDQSNCPVTSCEILNAGCSSAYSGSNLQMQSSSLWRISGKQNVNAGYSETVCVKCTYNQGNSVITYDNWQASQDPNPIDCSSALSNSNYGDLTISFDASKSTKTSVVNMNAFFSTSDSVNCPIQSCQIKKQSPSCSLAAEGTLNFELQTSGSTISIMADQNVPAGYSNGVCIKCNAPDGSSITQQWTLTQSPSPCLGAITQKSGASTKITIPFSESSSPHVGSDWSNYFDNTNFANCPISTCDLKAMGCVDAQPSEITVGASPSYNLIMEQNVVAGYTRNICLRCFYDNSLQSTTFDSIQVTQNSRPSCTGQLVPADAVIPDKVEQYDASISTLTPVTNGYSDFFKTLDSTWCPINNCALYDECANLTPFSHGSSITIESSAPFTIKAKRKIIAGYDVQMCIRCATATGSGQGVITKTWKYTQQPLDCTGKFVIAANQFWLEFSYDSINPMQNIGQGYQFFMDTLDAVNCPIVSCYIQIWDYTLSICSPTLQDTRIQVGSGPLFQLTYRRDIIEGYVQRICYICEAPDGKSNKRDYVARQYPIQCNIESVDSSKIELNYNSTNNIPSIQKSSYQHWFKSGSNFAYCQISEYNLYKDSNCQEKYTGSAIQLSNEVISVNSGSKDPGTTDVYFCAKSGSSQASKELSLHVCGHETVSVNEKKGNQLTITQDSSSSTFKSKEFILEYFQTSDARCQITKLELVTSELAKEAFTSEQVYFDSDQTLQVSFDKAVAQTLYIKASTAFGESPGFLLLQVIKDGQALPIYINKAPYFETKPQDIELFYTEEKNSFEVELPPTIDQNGDEVTIEAKKFPDQVTIENGKIVVKNVTEPKSFLLEIKLRDSNGLSSDYTINLKIKEKISDKKAASIFQGFFQGMEMENGTEVEDNECNIELCKNQRICLQCKSKVNKFNPSWTYDDTSYSRWKTHQKKDFIKLGEPVTMKINEFTRNGVLRIKFNQKLKVPSFIQRMKKGRILQELKNLKVREDIIDVQLKSKSEEISNYTLNIKDWRSDGIDLQFNFDQPLLISKKELDRVDCKIINPFLFVSESSGGYLQDSTQVLTKSVPKQMAKGISVELLQQAAEVVDQVSKTVLIIQLVAQLILKGSIEQILSMYYKLQLICYIYNIYLVKQSYPSNLEIFTDQLTSLIEFRSLQPEPLIQLVDEDFVLNDKIQQYLGTSQEATEHKSILEEFQLYIFAFIIISILSLLAAVLQLFFKERVRAVLLKVKDKMIWNGLIRLYQMNMLKLLVNPVMHVQDGEEDKLFYILFIIAISSLAPYSHYILHRFNKSIQQERSGLLLRDVRNLDLNWLYFPFFLYRRIIFILVPFIFSHPAFQLMGLITINLASIIIYGQMQPHSKQRNKIELMNECFVMIFSYHLICFSDFNSSLDSVFDMGFSCAGFLGLMIVINIGRMFLGVIINSIKRYLKRRDKSQNPQVEQDLEEPKVIDIQNDQERLEYVRETIKAKPSPLKLNTNRYKKKKVSWHPDIDVISEKSSELEESQPIAIKTKISLKPIMKVQAEVVNQQPSQSRKLSKQIVEEKSSSVDLTSICSTPLDQIDDMLKWQEEFVEKFGLKKIKEDKEEEKEQEQTDDEVIDEAALENQELELRNHEWRIGLIVQGIESIPDDGVNYRMVGQTPIVLDKRMVSQRQTKEQIDSEIQMLEREMEDEDIYDTPQMIRLRHSLLLVLQEQRQKFD